MRIDRSDLRAAHAHQHHLERTASSAAPVHDQRASSPTDVHGSLAVAAFGQGSGAPCARLAPFNDGAHAGAGAGVCGSSKDAASPPSATTTRKTIAVT